MAHREDTRSKGSGRSRVSIDTPIYLKTGPILLKPVKNMMFELDSTSTDEKTGSAKIDINNKAIGLLPLKIERRNLQEMSKSTTSTVSTNHEALSSPSLKTEQADKLSSTSASITHHAIDQDPIQSNPTSCQTVDKVPANTTSIIRQAGDSNSLDRVTKFAFPSLLSFGSFTISQLAHSGNVPTTKVEPKYNAGVLQGNWYDERKHPKYRPIHPPPLNTTNLEYRSTYRDSFLNHNLKDITSVKPIKKDSSLPPWFVDEEVKNVTRPQASKDQEPIREHAWEGYDGRDPHKGHDPDPFKRRDEYKTGYEYKLDAFQDNPRLWEKYRGRETYFKRKDHGRRGGGGITAENVRLQTGDGPISDEHGGGVQGTRRDNQTGESLVADQAQGHEVGRMGNSGGDNPHSPDMGQMGNIGHNNPHSPGISRHDPTMSHVGNMGRDNSHSPAIGHHDSPVAPNSDYTSHCNRQEPDMGRHDSVHAPNMSHTGYIGHYKQQAADLDHMAIARQIEADLKNLNRTNCSEYKSSFKPMETVAITSAARRRDRERVCGATRNISTFAF